MRNIISLLTIVVPLAACATAPPPPVVAPVTMTVPANAPECREYTAEATIDGKTQQIVGRACRRDDGSWQIVEGTAAQPAQVVAVYQVPPYPYPYYDPWYWGPPFGFGASFLFVDRHHHFHHREFHHGGHHGGMHHH
jgi:hypothetical protein